MKFDEIIGAFTVKELPESEVEMTGEIPFETVASYRERALRDIAAHLEVPGFRAGHIPSSVVVQKVGEMAVLEEALEQCLHEFYPELALVKNIDAVGRPDIRVTKLASGNPAGITIRTAYYPKISLPSDWRTIAKNTPKEIPAEVTETEISETLETLRQGRASKHEDGTKHLPELNDAFAQSLGALRDLAHLKEEVAKGIAEGKTHKAKDKRRNAIIEAVLGKTSVDVPRIFVESELEKMMARLKDDITRMGASFEEYLKQVNKTEETVRSDFHDQAKKRALLQLLLNELATREKVEPDKEAVEQEMAEALKHFPDANREALRVHIETVLRNEKILQKIEDIEE